MKTIVILITSMLIAASISAQTYIAPPFKGKSTSAVDIERIQITKSYTIVHMKCTSPESFIGGGWACITNTTYIQDIARNKKYTLLKVKGIPQCPRKYNFTKPGQTIRFKLYFPRIRYDVRRIHIIEDMNDVANPFNFFDVYLKPVA